MNKYIFTIVGTVILPSIFLLFKLIDGFSDFAAASALIISLASLYFQFQQERRQLEADKRDEETYKRSLFAQHEEEIQKELKSRLDSELLLEEMKRLDGLGMDRELIQRVLLRLYLECPPYKSVAAKKVFRIVERLNWEYIGPPPNP